MNTRQTLEELYAHGRFKEVVDGYDQATQEEQPGLLPIAAAALRHLGRPTSALQRTRECAGLRLDAFVPLILDALLELKLTAIAERWLRDLQKRHSPPVSESEVRLLLELNRYEEALQVLDHIPATETAQGLRVFALTSLDRGFEAAPLVQSLLLNDFNLRLYIRALGKHGQFEDAKRIMAEEEPRFVKDPAFYCLAGDLSVWSEDLSEAAKRYGRALEIEPKHIQATTGAAHVLTRNGHKAEATDLLEPVLAVEPLYEPGHKLLLQLYARTGKIAAVAKITKRWATRQAELTAALRKRIA